MRAHHQRTTSTPCTHSNLPWGSILELPGDGRGPALGAVEAVMTRDAPLSFLGCFVPGFYLGEVHFLVNAVEDIIKTMTVSRVHCKQFVKSNLLLTVWAREKNWFVGDWIIGHNGARCWCNCVRG